MKKTTVCTRQTVAVKNRKWECLIIRKRILILANGVPVISTLYYKIVVFKVPLQGLCYTVRDAVDWLSAPTARRFL
ncbi:hypothetical protein DXB06_02020, partial [Butyricicoccus sp. OF13-6]